MDIHLRALELACSKLCHDVISPIGAVNNGLELLEEEEDAALKEEATALAQRSAKATLIIVFESDLSLLRGVFEQIDHSKWMNEALLLFVTDADDRGSLAGKLAGAESIIGQGVHVLEHPPSRARLGEAASDPEVRAIIGELDRSAVHVDLDQRTRRHLLEHQVVGIEQEVMLRPRHARRHLRSPSSGPITKVRVRCRSTLAPI